MSFIRRHLAAFGLAVALLQSTLQAVLPVGLCCTAMTSAAPAAPEAKTHCCTASSDANGTCPMHHDAASRRVHGKAASECRLVCASRGDHALLSLTLGGPLPHIVTTIDARDAFAAPV